MNVYRVLQRGIDKSVEVCVDLVSKDDGNVDASRVLAAKVSTACCTVQEGGGVVAVLMFWRGVADPTYPSHKHDHPPVPCLLSVK